MTIMLNGSDLTVTQVVAAAPPLVELVTRGVVSPRAAGFRPEPTDVPSEHRPTRRPEAAPAGQVVLADRRGWLVRSLVPCPMRKHADHRDR